MTLLDKIQSPSDLDALTVEELNLLAVEIRHFLLSSISETGGHLASNLGVVELTLALHKVFDSPDDKIIWDVGHQSYVHKLLTGRKTGFTTLRQLDGMSGFPKRSESPHDIADTGHSSTSLSLAAGLAAARDLDGRKHHIAAVIGDGSMTAGMAYEALNHIGHEQRPMLVVLNDNNMSISKNTGALSKYLNRLRTAPRYTKAKSGVKGFTDKVPVIGKSLSRKIDKAKDSIKYLFIPGVIFEEMGFKYIGPVDGHDLGTLLPLLERVKGFDRPVLLHLKTQKGRGYAFAENHPDKYHGVSPFDLKTGKKKQPATAPTYSRVFGGKLTAMAEKDRRITAITAAMPDGTGLKPFMLSHPDRFFDVGIAEQHAVTLAAGLAAGGKRPFVALYSSFLQRAYDQVIHDVCLQNLPVVFCIDRAGLVGADGETHHGNFDLSFLLPIPNLTLLSPKDGPELESMMDYALSLNGPVAIRYPRGAASALVGEPSCPPLPKVLGKGLDCAIVSEGSATQAALSCADLLKAHGVEARVVHIGQIKPIHKEDLLAALEGLSRVVTLENGAVLSGMGSFLRVLAGDDPTRRFLHLGYPDRFIPHGDTETLKKRLGLDPESLCRDILAFLKDVM